MLDVKRLNLNERRMALAYHEAGHAVAQLIQGLKIKAVSIKARERSAGRSDGYARGRAFRAVFANSPTAWDIAPRHKNQFEKEVRSLLAGEVAQRRFAPRSVRGWQTRQAHHGDMPQVEDLIRRIAPSDREFAAYFKLLMIQTELLIEQYWPCVEAIAAALNERESLTGNEVSDVFKRERQAEIERRRRASQEKSPAPPRCGA